MNVVADISCTQDPTAAERGIPTYAREHAKAIERLAPDAVSSWTISPSGPVAKGLDFLLSTGKLRRVGDPEVGTADVVHVMSPFYEKVDVWSLIRGTRARVVVTLYDLIPLVYPNVYLSSLVQRAAYDAQLQLVRCADLVLCISEATRRDAIKYLGLKESRVKVIGTGVEDHFHPPVDPTESFKLAQSAVPELQPGFVMCTSGIEFRKNVDRLIEAYALLRREVRAKHQLVIVCRISDETRARLLGLAFSLGIDPSEILFTGLVSPEALVALYQSAHLFVFPSLYEGFGLPVAEAMAAGAPCIVSDNSSLIELQPLAAGRFDPEDVREMSSVIDSAIVSGRFRDQLLSVSANSQHTWESVAKRTVDAYGSLGPTPVLIPAKRDRPRIALVGPMPPAHTGVADYNGRLLPELLQHVDVDVFSQADAHRPEIDGARWFHQRSFDTAESLRGPYDATIICMGNSPFHHDALRILARAGGATTVVSHDVNLQDMYSDALRYSPSLVSRYAHDIVWRRTGTILPDTMESYVAHREPEFFHYNNPLSLDTVRMSERFLVHSRTAATLAKSEADPLLHPRIDVLKFAFRDVTAVPYVGRDAVISMGIVAPPKQSLKVIEAFLSVAPHFPNTVFAVVGHIAMDPALQRDIRQRIAELGLQARVVLPGRVSAMEYDSWLARGKLAVQLRDLSKGESSAAIADCLSYGVPVVASDVGAARELPSKAISLVPREIPSEELAGVVTRMLNDPEMLYPMSMAGIEHAALNSFAEVASELLKKVGLAGFS